MVFTLCYNELIMIVERINNIRNDFNKLKLKQLSCDCEWCKVNIEQCDNYRMNDLLNLSIALEEYELSGKIKEILNYRNENNIIYDEKYKR